MSPFENSYLFIVLLFYGIHESAADSCLSRKSLLFMVKLMLVNDDWVYTATYKARLIRLLSFIHGSFASSRSRGQHVRAAFEFSRSNHKRCKKINLVAYIEPDV